MTERRVRQVGLIGWPVEHSVSPEMHNAAYAALGLEWQYLAWPVLPEDLEATIWRLGRAGCCGLNVTTPHKQAVIPLLDTIAANARQLGAVNTLVLDQREAKPAIAGYNTDDQGFIRAVRQGGFEPEAGRRAVVVGAGGAARAVVYGLLASGMGGVLVLNRTAERAEALISDLGRWQAGPGGSRLSAWPLSPEALVESARQADLLVQTTTVGMWPHQDASIWPEKVPVPAHLAVCDLVYNPLETRLLVQARQAGALAIGGLDMLVQQGALAFELWTGRAAPVEVMRAAAYRALQR